MKLETKRRGAENAEARRVGFLRESPHPLRLCVEIKNRL